MPLEIPATNDPAEESLYDSVLEVGTAPGAPTDVQTRAAHYLIGYVESGRASEAFVLRVWQRTSPEFWRLVGPDGSLERLHRRVLEIYINRDDIPGEADALADVLRQCLPNEGKEE